MIESSELASPTRYFKSTETDITWTWDGRTMWLGDPERQINSIFDSPRDILSAIHIVECDLGFNKIEPTEPPKTDTPALLEEALRLLRIVEEGHRNIRSRTHYYGCDTHPCAWCLQARNIIPQ